ncbi:MAG: hypothetical protein IH985_08040, partial [Planctomycetes bacterium]|nr:hypothetical protein [Planctomycetota bacterium]
WDDYVTEFGQNKAAGVLKALKAIQGKRAHLSAEGTVATFKFSTGGEMYFKKDGDRWYFINRPPGEK